ncbi:MAG: 5/3-nucleotidase [Actinomycetota bacterium]|nr:5/3-nucleotidase [Actinomycetota bacterium]
MRVLVTNDDGVSAPGLLVLAQAMVAAGHDVVVAAPLTEHSGASAAIGPVHLTGGVTFERVELDGLPGVPVFGLDGPPALAVLAARLEGFGPPPELVASGINPGNNTGRAVLHSGTVGAALAAANFGLSGVAVSVGSGEPLRFDTAAPFAVAAVEFVAGAPPGTVLNVNVPGLPLDEVVGVVEARLAPFGTVRTVIVGAHEDRFAMELQPTEVELEPDTDTARVLEGYVAVTSLVGPRGVGADGASAFIEDRSRRA